MILNQPLPKTGTASDKSACSKIPERIVAEVSKSWPETKDVEFHSLRALFEDIIRVNRERGYKLESWQFSQCPCRPGIIETIIAVFVKV